MSSQFIVLINFSSLSILLSVASIQLVSGRTCSIKKRQAAAATNEWNQRTINLIFHRRIAFEKLLLLQCLAICFRHHNAVKNWNIYIHICTFAHSDHPKQTGGTEQNARDDGFVRYINADIFLCVHVWRTNTHSKQNNDNLGSHRARTGRRKKNATFLFHAM